MSHRQSCLAYLALLAGVVALASSFARPSPGQGAARTSELSRYQIAAAGGNSPEVFVIDTATGQTWSRSSGGSSPWRDFGIPPGAK
jgi:hypothetical protein